MPADLVISLVAVTLSVALLSGVLASSVLRRYAPERKRLRQITRPQPNDTWREPLGLTSEPNALAERICRVMPRSSKRMGEMRQRLVSAGYRSKAAPAVFAASQIVCAIVAGVTALALSGVFAAGLLSLIAGFTCPGLWLKYEGSKRGRVIQNGLPDVLDLLIVCLESGCSLDQAILKSGEELALAYKALGDELALVANEIRAGKPRAEAFTNFADRTGVDDVRSLVIMLIQTDRYGTRIPQALRVHADVLRTRRRQRAEERAAKASVKLVFPLVLCLFPAFYILTLGPALLQFFRTFMNAVSDFK
jgi:tight adherence protein C